MIGVLCGAMIVGTVCVTAALAQNRYTNTILVANDASYEPLRLVDPLIGNGWGLSLRPPGAGGHFWISNANTGTTTTYVGDVHTPGGFVPLFQDALTVVDIPIGAGTRIDGRPVTETSIPTGQVYNFSTTDFVVSGEGITNASKFIFVTGDGTISGWTEFRTPDGVLHRQTRSVITVDTSQNFDDDRLQYTGCAVTDFAQNNRLYVANWTAERVEVYDHNWQPIALPPGRFQLDSPGEIWRPWNIQYFRTGPSGEGRIWVTFNKAEDPWEEYPDFGAVVEYDLEGNLIRRFYTSVDFDPYADSELRDPWGLAIAPPNFGPLAGKMLVANFGDGTIAAFDLVTGHFVDFVRGNDGEPLVVDGIWGITFGNGVALGDSDALYYAAGPNGEADGAFGTVRYTPSVCPVIQSQPSSIVACRASGAAVLSVAAPSPVRTRFRWQIEAQPGGWADLADGVSSIGAIAGSTTDTLHIPGLSAGAEFRCVISNVCGEATSASVTVTLGIPGDADADDAVGLSDLAVLINHWGESVPPAPILADLDGSGDIGLGDVAAAINSWGTSCP